jgi:hypothetical protein
VHVPRPGRHGVRRRAAQAALVTAATATIAFGGAGAASAAPPRDIVPLLDCYTQNQDGSYTVVLGYSSTFGTTQTLTPGSKDNYSTPSTYDTSLPTTFTSGTRHGALSLTVTAAEAEGAASWYLYGHRLNYRDASRASGVCPPDTQMPTDGNGAGTALGLVAAGSVGVVVLSRARRRAAAAAAGPVGGV